MMRRFLIIAIGIVMLSGSLMAQDSLTSGSQSSEKKMPKRNRITYEQMTEKMVKELKLDVKQQKKVTKLNKEYKTLIEGQQMERPQGQRPPMGERQRVGDGTPGMRPNGNGGGRPNGGMGGPGGGGFGPQRNIS